MCRHRGTYIAVKSLNVLLCGPFTYNVGQHSPQHLIAANGIRAAVMSAFQFVHSVHHHRSPCRSGFTRAHVGGLCACSNTCVFNTLSIRTDRDRTSCATKQTAQLRRYLSLIFAGVWLDVREERNSGPRCCEFTRKYDLS